jgi:ankyrin repeat protein
MKALTSFPQLEDEYVNLDLTSLHDFIMQGDNEQLARQVKLNPRRSSSIRDVWGATPLHWAATFGNIEAIRVLLEAGADVDAVCKRGRSVLHWAVRTESVQCCKILVDAGANVNILDSEGLTVLMSLMGLASDPDDIMDILLEAGVDVDVQNHTGMTALMSAAQRYSPDACAKILNYGANLELRDHVGGNATFHAVYYRNDAALAFLIDKGASLLNLDNRGRSIVHYAAANANLKVMGILERASIEGVPTDDATVKSWWTWFYDRDTWYRGIRASHKEEVSAFQALIASIKSPPISEPDTVSSFRIPGEFPKDG